MKKELSNNSKKAIQYMVRVAIFGSISILLYSLPFLSFPLGIFPSFLELHFDEIPAFIAGFAYGPLTSFGIIAIKTIVKFIIPGSSTMGVGELIDLISSVAFIIPAALIYKKLKNPLGFSLGLVVGTILQLAVSLLSNIYFILPFYMFVMGYDANALLAACQQVNPAITDLGWSYGLLAVLPFNVIKDFIVLAITIVIYLILGKYIEKIGTISQSKDVPEK